MVWRVDLRSILVNSRSILDPYMRNLTETSRIAFIWPWVGPQPQNMTNIGYWDGLGLGTGIAHPGTTQPYPTPGTPPLTVTAVHVPGMQSPRLNMVVGLKSVAQLSLSHQISGF